MKQTAMTFRTWPIYASSLLSTWPFTVLNFSLSIGLSLLITPGSDAIGPLTVFTKAKLVTKAIIAKGALLAPKLVLAKGAILGGIIGGHFASKAGAPLLLAKSKLPNLVSLAPLLKGKKKVHHRPYVAPIPAPPVYIPQVPAPVYAPTYQKTIPSYSQSIKTGY